MRESRQQNFQPRNQYPVPEERVAFPERLLKNEFGYEDEEDDDEDEGVFEEQPVRPAYAQRLQFFGGNEVRVLEVEVERLWLGRKGVRLMDGIKDG